MRSHFLPVLKHDYREEYSHLRRPSSPIDQSQWLCLHNTVLKENRAALAFSRGRIFEIPIQFRNFHSSEICISVNTKEAIKEYIFDYFNIEFPDIKTYASNAKIRLSNDDKRKCFWILFKRCKLIINRNKEYYNKDVYNMDLKISF